MLWVTALCSYCPRSRFAAKLRCGWLLGFKTKQVKGFF